MITILSIKNSYTILSLKVQIVQKHILFVAFTQFQLMGNLA